MDSDRELLQQALEALEMLTDDYDDDVVGLEIDAITALRARLAQPEPEPVAWINEEQTIGPDYGKKRLSFKPYYSDNPLHYKHTPLYAAPPARQWVGLTDEDKQDLYSNWGVSLAAMHFVSERLKAKNGGTE